MNYAHGLNPNDLFQWKNLPELPDIRHETQRLIGALRITAHEADRLADTTRRLADATITEETQ